MLMRRFTLNKATTALFNNNKTVVLCTAPHQNTSSNSTINNNNIIFNTTTTTQVRGVRRLPNKKVIVLQDHGNLFANDIVMVKAGYMRNYLFPKRIADYATPENLELHAQNLTPEMQRDLEEKKKGERIAKLLKTSPTIELTRPTKQAVVEVIGQRKELTKKIDLFEVCRIISDHFSIVVQPFDILQVYQPDVDRLVTDFEKEGVVVSGLYDVQFKTSQFSTGNVRLNIISVVDKAEIEKRRLQRLEKERKETEEYEKREKERLEKAEERRTQKAAEADNRAADELMRNADPTQKAHLEQQQQQRTPKKNDRRERKNK